MATNVLRLTVKAVEAIVPPTSGRDYYRDERNQSLVLQVTPSGGKVWYLQIVDSGRTRRIKLAPYSQADFEIAKRLAAEKTEQIAMGADPVALKRAARVRATVAGMTLRDLLKDYLADRAHKLKTSTQADYLRSLEQFCPALMDLPVESVSAEQVLSLYKTKAKTAPYVADRGRRVLSAIFRHHQTRYKDEAGEPRIKANPARVIIERGAKVKIERRKRIVHPEQMPAWREAVQGLTDKHYSALLQFLIFTGCRYSEAAALRWQDVNLQAEHFTLQDTKNRQTVQLPLPKTICATLDRLGKEGPLVFSETDEPRSNLPHRYKAVRNAGIIFSPHDLRRTFITTAEELDIGWLAIKKLVNHLTDSDVTGGYVNVSLTRLRRASNAIERALLAQMAGNKNWVAV
ncbi:tyrosine-type recombinase/integrase [Stutzerimonas stutzeri]|uniref:tyrosine-type recombinase/integrase n=1 Tax=Stutzerimonas stutzeri TaxID=316 RepID=UPI003EE06F93